MPASKRASQRQLEMLLAFTEANRDIALGRCTRGPQASQIARQAWQTITNKLNAVADGVSKTAEGWRRYWVEWKAKTKAKGADFRRNASRTGGGPNKLAPLNELENRILQLTGRVSVEGLPGVRVPFPISSESLPQPTTSQNSSSNPTFSQMEVEWLDEENFPPNIPQPLPSPSQPVPLISHTGRPQSLSPSPLQPLPQQLQSTQQPTSLNVDRLEAPSLQQPPPPHSAQSSPRRRSRRRLIRNRDVPQWALNLEERRIAVEERHVRALEALSATLDRRLGNILDKLNDISNKLENK